MLQKKLNQNWTLKPETASDRFTSGPISLNFPTDIHTELLKDAVIEDPYFEKNELKMLWVGQENWVCTKEFTLEESFLKGRQFISITQADTYVRIFINEKEVGLCNNFFKAWRFEVSEFLQKGQNSIKLVFESNENHAIALANKYPYPVPCSIYDVVSPHRNFVRKPQCHAGWDWGPNLMALGIYSDIVLERTATGFLDYLETSTTKTQSNSTETQDWLVRVTSHFTSLTNTTISHRLDFSGPHIEPISIEKKVKLVPGLNTIHTEFTVKNPELWYVVGMSPEDEEAILKTGRPLFKDNPLYQLEVKAGGSKKEKNIGFRTLEVVNEEDKDGISLYFKVNDRALFAKGTNWIPLDALPARQTEERYEYLLESLIHGNMNTIRVWGGGMYEKDFFYDYCDRKGILVWQDFMFACGLYPTDKAFLDSVRDEVRHQILRLKDHPSLALWCGNNENLGALTWYPESIENRDLYLIDYDRLNEGVIGDEVKKLDPNRIWWPSSPCAGPDRFENNWTNDNMGDMHYWEVWHQKKSFDAYLDIRPRFVSEFGYQSFPSLSTVQSYTSENPINLTHPVMEFHQRSPGGNSIMMENFTRYFRFPKSTEKMLYLSQVQQALAIKTACEYWRSLKPYCMGSLIWQLNDNCPVASWSSIDYTGKWKMLHHEAKKFFSPIALSMYSKDEKLFIFGVNDIQKKLDAKLCLSFYNFSGEKIQEDIQRNVSLKADAVSELFSSEIEKLPKDISNYFLYAKLEITTEKGKTQSYEATQFLDLYKKLDIKEAAIDYTITEKSITELPSDILQMKHSRTSQFFQIDIEVKAPAFFVSLDAASIKGLFSDNLLTILPQEKKRVYFIPETKTSLQKFKKMLKVEDLRSSY